MLQVKKQFKSITMTIQDIKNKIRETDRKDWWWEARAIQSDKDVVLDDDTSEYIDRLKDFLGETDNRVEEKRKAEKANRVLEWLKEHLPDIDWGYYAPHNDFEDLDRWREVSSMVDDDSYFEGESFNWASGIEYLAKNDPSLRKSLELAEDMGHTLRTLSSEELANLLSASKNRVEFDKYETDFEGFIEELDEELESFGY